MRHDHLVNFRYNLKLLMCAKEMSAEQLSIKLGFGKGRISNLSCGQTPPTMEDLASITSYFGISYDALLVDRITLTTRFLDEPKTV